MKISNRNYSGKKVFVGIDVHKKTYVISAYCDGDVVKKWTTPARAQALADQLGSYFFEAEILSAYEAGFSGFSLHRTLIAAGVKNIVVNAASIEVEANNRVKTDKRDARKIAEQLSANRLRGIYIPTEEEEARRSLSRGREQVVERRKAIGNQLKMKLYYLGIEISDDRKLTLSFLKWTESLELKFEHKMAIKEYSDAWRQETDRIKRFNAALQKQAGKDSNERIYRSAPGVGIISARTLSNELGDMTRFDNERQLFSHSGLTPSEHSSGEHIRRGHISRQGSPRIRGLLTEVAWRAIAADRSLKEFYIRIASTRDSKRAIIAVARKILGRLRHCLKNQVEWKDLKVESECAA
jgi:transposase